MKIYNCKQGTPEWFSCRAGKLTASNAQAIATGGKGLETLCYEKVAEILTGKPKENGFTSIDIERGHLLEAEARGLYELKTNNQVFEVGFCELDEFTGASPDGVIGYENGLVEIKCLNDPKFVRVLTGEKIDPAHLWQMQMQMWVTESKWCDYVIFNPNFKDQPMVVRRVNRDETQINEVAQGVKKGIEFIKAILERVT